jgi:cytochrome c biogenesis protein
MGFINRKKVLKKLANLQLAISLLLLIGVIIAVGTIIEQDQSLAFYKESYPETNPLFGFLTWKTILFFHLNQLYTNWWFFCFILLFASSLLACTFTTQLPSIKTFKLWKFLTKQSQYDRLNTKSKVNLDYYNSVAYNCNEQKYHFFKQKNTGYAYSGLLGRVAPVVVHISIILLLFGSSLNSLGGYNVQEIVPRGEIAHFQNLIKVGNFTNVPQTLSCRINDFWITYTKEFKTDQFYSDLSLLDQDGKELKRKVVFVNEPLLFNNTTIYQTDWDIVGVKARINNDVVFQIPLKRITKGGNRFWFGSLPISNNNRENLTVVSNDLRGKLYLYNTQGKLVTDTEIGSRILVSDNLSVQFSDFITSTGLQIKSDPGIFVTYSSFLLLMVSVYVSFLTYSQIWFLEKKEDLNLGGTSNRAVLFFQNEYRKIIKRSA